MLLAILALSLDFMQVSLGQAALTLRKENHRSRISEPAGLHGTRNKLQRQNKGPWRQVQNISLGLAAPLGTFKV